MPKNGNKTAKEERENLLTDFFNKCLGCDRRNFLKKSKFNNLECSEDLFRERPDKKDQWAVFTSNRVWILLEMLLRVDPESNQAIDKAIKIIKANTSFSAAYDDSSQNSKKFQSCKYKKEYKKNSVYCSCTIRMCDDIKRLAPLLEDQEISDLKKKDCNDCPIHKIYCALEKIENETDDVLQKTKIKRKAFVREQYCNSENDEEKIVDDAYKVIKNYENAEKSHLKNEEDIDCKCEKVSDIENVADAKMAYVKWYYGHLLTWPYFKRWYRQIQNQKFSKNSEHESMIAYEEKIYCQEIAAVNICLRLIELEDTELEKYQDLAYNAAIDKIVSCIYLNQYKRSDNLMYEYSNIIDECIKILNFPASAKAKAGLYIEMMNLSYYTRNDNDAAEYEENIIELLESTEIKIEEQEKNLLYIRYFAYKYFYHKINYECMKENVTQYYKSLRKMGEYNDTAEMMKTAILYRTQFDYIEDVNPAITLKGFEGYDPKETISVNVYGIDNRNPDKYTPSAYSRIYCEYYPNADYYPGIKNQIKLL